MTSSPSLESSSAASSPSSSSNRYCFVVLGSGGVGKSTLSIQYVQGVFVSTYDPTIMDCLMRSDTVRGKTVSVTVIDTAGQQDYMEQAVPYLRSADLCILVYSITDAASMSQVASYFTHAIQSRRQPTTPFIVVGNKLDLDAFREVTPDQGRRLAMTLAGRLNLSSAEMLSLSDRPLYMETSGTNHADAVKLFRSAVLTVQRYRETGKLMCLEEPPEVLLHPSSQIQSDDDTDTASNSGATLPTPRSIHARPASMGASPTIPPAGGEDGRPVLVFPTIAGDDVLGGSTSSLTQQRPAIHTTSTTTKKRQKKKSTAKGGKPFRCVML